MLGVYYDGPETLPYNCWRPQPHHSQFMLIQVRISHRMLAEQMKELRNSQSNKKILKVFIRHFHTNDLYNRESSPKLFDVASGYTYVKDGCASVAGVDVANPCVNSSYFQFVMKQMYYQMLFLIIFQIGRGADCVSTGVVHTEDVDRKDPMLGLFLPSWEVNDY